MDDKIWARSLRKTELHAHLNGSISLNDLRELAAKRGAHFPAESEIQLPGSPGFTIDDCFTLFSSTIYSIVQDAEALQFVVGRVLAAFETDGCTYLELRTTPRETALMSRRKYVDAVVQAVESYRNNDGVIDGSTKMTVRLLFSVDRRHNIETANDVVDLAIAYNFLHPDLVVGVDVCGNPLAGGIRHLVPALTRVKETNCSPPLKLVIHFAEVATLPEEGELETILLLQPDRLGHCTFVPEKLMDVICQRGIPMEICLSSNVLGGTVSEFEKHHLVHLWHERNYRNLVLCTDDRGIFCSELSDEYLIAQKVLGLSRLE
ncbi:hypothetical protein HK100_012578, partial [Physocladia obscura]